MLTRVLSKALLVRKDGKILVLWRSKDDIDSPGEPDFPGGGVEVGEDPLSAVVREIREETGVAIDARNVRIGYTFTRYDDATAVPVVRILNITHTTEPLIIQLSPEHYRYEWLSAVDIAALFEKKSYGEALRFLLGHNLLPQ